MFDLLGLFLIVIFSPIIIINGMKHYKISINKTLQVLVYILLGFELFRFFYTAQFYDKAYMPADKVTFTFVTFSVVVALFAVFNKSKIGEISKTILVFTSFAPIIMALFYPHVFTNELDTYAVTKALYFAESGIIITMALLLVKEEVEKCNINSLLFSLGFVAIYIFANVMRNIFWIPNMEFDLTWFLCMGSIILSVIVFYLGNFMFSIKEEPEVINE